MKKTLLFLVFVIVVANLTGQDHHVINFAGVNADPETVLVKNLTQDTEVTMRGNQTLHLIIKGVWVEELLGLSENRLAIYPNPFEYSCIIEFENVRSGWVEMHFYSISGKLLHQFSDDLSAGQHAFLLSGVSAGSFLVSIQTPTGLLSGKFFVTGQGNGALSLQHINETPWKINHSASELQASLPGAARSGRTVVEMNFWPGDLLLFLGMAGGFDNIAIYDTPDDSQTYTFEFANYWPQEYVHCLVVPTTVMEATNPQTGKIWMDRNLGASQVATSLADEAAYGDLYQWGRFADGHQCRNSLTTSTLSESDQPGHGAFILTSGYPGDWRSPANFDLWQIGSQINNPCPSGFRLPTSAEWNEEVVSWNGQNAEGAFLSPLKFSLTGFRGSTGSINLAGISGIYWASNTNGPLSGFIRFSNTFSEIAITNRGNGIAVRCFKE